MDLYLSVGNSDTPKKMDKLFQEGVDAVFLDFDYTMTSATGTHSWGHIDHNPNISEESRLELKRLYEAHMPVETSVTATRAEKVDNAKAWYAKSLPTVSSNVETVADLERILAYRPEKTSQQITLKPHVVTLLKELRERQIPCIVFSAGVGDVVRKTLMAFDSDAFGVHIVSNFMLFSEEGSESTHKFAHHCTSETAKFARWSHPTITSANKEIRTVKNYLAPDCEDEAGDDDMEDEIVTKTIDFQSVKNIVLVGDTMSDAYMCDGLSENVNVLKICFLTDNYDHPSSLETSEKDVETCDPGCVVEKSSTQPGSQKRNITSGAEYYETCPDRLVKMDVTVKIEDGVVITTESDHIFDEELLLRNDPFEPRADLRDFSRVFDIVLENSTEATFAPVHALVVGAIHASKRLTNLRYSDDVAATDGYSTETDHAKSLLSKVYHGLDNASNITMVSVSGFGRSGKDTVFNTLSDAIEVEKLAYADTLRECAESTNPNINVSEGDKERYARYRDLLDMVGYEEAKTLYPNLRGWLIALGQGARDYLHRDCWLQWAFNKATPLFEVVAKGEFSAESEIDMTFRVYNHVVASQQHSWSIHNGDDLSLNAQFLFDFAEFAARRMISRHHVDAIIAKDPAEVMQHRDDLESAPTSATAPQRILFLLYALAVRETCLKMRSDGIGAVDERQKAFVSVLLKIITDARYHNERAKAYGMGGPLVYVYIPGLAPASITEKLSLENTYYHAVIRNDSTLNNYETTILMVTSLMFCQMSAFAIIPLFQVCAANFDQ